MNKSWFLEDARKLAEEHPTSFAKPSREVLEPLEKGHKVKLIFNFKSNDPKIPSSERLWVELLLVQDNKLLGQLEDEPTFIKDLHIGEIIEFEERHILETD